MRFSFKKIFEKGVELVVLKDEKTGTSVSVLPSVGVALHDFTIQSGNGPVNIIDNYNDLAQAKKEMTVSYKSAKLSPFVCRIPGGKYSFADREWEFTNKFFDGSAIHGLIHSKPFAITHEQTDEGSVAVFLQYDYMKDDPGYPYRYACHVKYILSANNELKIETVITNKTEKTIPIADGWHPYFQLGGNVDEWMLRFNAKAIVEFDDKLIPTGKLLDYDLFKDLSTIGSKFFDNCFLLNNGTSLPACELFNPQNKLKLSFFPDNSYPYLQIYTPPHRKSIAIENLSSAPDSFNNKMGLIMLAPGHSKSFTVRYQLSWS
ncbi:MAG: aldose 1-epimerase [Bacteroidetes bacterium]|nr:aldose 1-epimerase [Bacteroidota bacterium]